jgi:hypothetical protein
MYLGGSIMTFALPYAAFILIATGLFFLFRAKHRGPRLKYLSPGAVASVGTREPGPVPAPAAKAPATPMDAAAASESDIVAPPSVHPEAEVAEARAEGQAIDAETEGREGTE